MYTKEKIKEMSREIHGNKYDLSLVEDVQNLLGKIRLVCPKHGVFEQTLHNHLQGKGCKKCYEESRVNKCNYTKEEFIECVKKTHDDFDMYDFVELPDKFSLKNLDKVIELLCKKHGKFKIKYRDFLNGEKCPYCNGKLKTDEEINRELSILHPELDFSVTKFSEHDEKYNITVICPKHGVQKVRYYNLLNGQGGCVECGWQKIADKEKTSREDFLEMIYKVHGEKYDTSMVNFINMRTNVTMICPEHGPFDVMPSNLIYRKSGCPICNNNHLEDEICRFLNEQNIKYTPQKHFKWLGRQSLDFYLPEYNVGIECQGIQHFIPKTFQNDTSNLNEMFLYTLKNDQKKYNLCKNKIVLFYYTIADNFREVYYFDEKYGNIYNYNNIFFDKDEMLKKIRGLK